MRRDSHQILGFATGVTIGHAAGWPLWQAAAAGATAAVTAGGRLSPDCDQYASWRRLWAPFWRAFARLVTLLPWWHSERHRHGDPVQHRGFTHWPGIPAIWSAVLAAAQYAAPAPAWTPWWLAWCGIAGWTSHLLGDAVHGRTFHGQDGHGVPLAPWWGHWGVGIGGRALKSGGAAELWLTTPVLVGVTLVQAAMVLGVT